VQRADDAEDVIRQRLKVYVEQTMPVIAAYAERGVVQEVDGSGEPQAVLARLQTGLAEA
jgi:adenylate kinase